MKILKKEFKLNSKSRNKRVRGRLEINSKTIEETTNNSAFSYDRDKNLFYRPNDESIAEIYDDDGYHTMMHSSWHQSSRYH